MDSLVWRRTKTQTGGDLESAVSPRLTPETIIGVSHFDFVAQCSPLAIKRLRFPNLKHDTKIMRQRRKNYRRGARLCRGKRRTQRKATAHSQQCPPAAGRAVPRTPIGRLAFPQPSMEPGGFYLVPCGGACGGGES